MSSTASSSISSRVTSRASSQGVPTRCWCGERVVTFTSKTNDNPYRRFFRCEVGLQRKNENHLFTWLDDALLEEIRMVDAKHRRLVQDVEDVRKNIMENTELEKQKFEKMEKEMVLMVTEKVEKELTLAKIEMEKMGQEITYSTLKKIGVCVVGLVLLAWFFGWMKG